MKSFLFQLVGFCISNKQKEIIISEFRSNVDYVETIDELSVEKLAVVKSQYSYQKRKKMMMSDELKVKKIEAILRKNKLKITGDKTALIKINKVIKGIK